MLLTCRRLSAAWLGKVLLLPALWTVSCNGRSVRKPGVNSEAGRGTSGECAADCAAGADTSTAGSGDTGNGNHGGTSGGVEAKAGSGGRAAAAGFDNGGVNGLGEGGYDGAAAGRSAAGGRNGGDAPGGKGGGDAQGGSRASGAEGGKSGGVGAGGLAGGSSGGAGSGGGSAGELNCPLGSEDGHCRTSEPYTCHDGTIIRTAQLCDAFVDCPDGSDEGKCATGDQSICSAGPQRVSAYVPERGCVEESVALGCYELIPPELAVGSGNRCVRRKRDGVIVMSPDPKWATDFTECTEEDQATLMAAPRCT